VCFGGGNGNRLPSGSSPKEECQEVPVKYMGTIQHVECCGDQRCQSCLWQTRVPKHWISIYHQFLSRFCSVHGQMEVSGPSSYASKWPYFCPGNLRWNIKEKTRVPLWLSQAVLSGLQLPLDNKLGTSWDPQNLGLKDVFPSISELAQALEWYNWRVSFLSSLDRCYASGASWSASRRGPQKWWRWLHQLQHFIHK